MTKLSVAAMRVYGIEPEWDSLKWKSLLGSDPDWAICKAVNDELCSWTDKEWQSLDKAYKAFLKKLKYL